MNRTIDVEITARIPGGSGGGDVTVTLGAWTTSVTVGSRWTTHRFSVDAGAAEAGLSALTVTWPDLAEGPTRWTRVLADLAHDRVPDLHPVFGEVHSLVVA